MSETDIKTFQIKQKPLPLWRIIREDIKCVFERDPAARTTLEVMMTYPGLHAIIAHRIANRLWTRGFRFVPRLLAFFNRTFTNIDIHPGATIGRRFFIDHGAGVVVGETAEVGDDVTLYHGVTLGGTSWNKGKRHPTLGHGVMVGAGAKILGPIEIGDKVRVGSNSVVVKDVPAESTVVGIPGKIVQVREAGQVNEFGIDLDHHLIPDPVGKAMACMMERITELEDMVALTRRQYDLAESCEECEAEDLCDPAHERHTERPLIKQPAVGG